MQLTEHVWLVGSGAMGFSITENHDCHVYLIADGNDAALIDSGAGIDSQSVLDEIGRAGVQHDAVRSILLTHAHADHSGGAADLARALGAEVLASTEVGRILRDADAAAAGFDRLKEPGGYPEDYEFRGCSNVGRISPGDRIAIGDLEIDVVDGGGHSAGHLCFLLRRAGGVDLFSGDAVFALGRILLQDLPDCSISHSTATVRRLADIRPDGLFPGHGAVAIHGASDHLRSALHDIRSGLPPRQLTF